MLLACAEAPRYGYEIAGWLAAEGLVTGTVSPGRLYETLGALARQGALASVDEPSDKGPARRRYRLTDTGRSRLAAWATALERSAAVLARLLTRMALLDPAVPPRVDGAPAFERHPDHHDQKGGEAMSCQCRCGGPATPLPAPDHSPEPATATRARSVEERLDTIEALLENLSTR